MVLYFTIHYICENNYIMSSPAVSFRFKPETILLLKKISESMERSSANTVMHLIHNEAQKRKIKVSEKEIEEFLATPKKK